MSTRLADDEMSDGRVWKLGHATAKISRCRCRENFGCRNKSFSLPSRCCFTCAMAEVTKKRRLSSDGKAVSTKVANHDDVNEKSQRQQLFVRSLPTSVTSERLTEVFSQSYPLKHATVVTDRTTKNSKGFGFVTFADANDAQAAAQEFDDFVLEGRKIKVEVAEPRHRELAEGAGNKSAANTTASRLKEERQALQKDNEPPKLIVRNLPWRIKEAHDLALLFRSYGKVKHAVVPKRSPKVQTGFGFVVLRGRKNAEKALAEMNGKDVDGRTIAVDWAVDKETWQGIQNGSRPEGGEHGQMTQDGVTDGESGADHDNPDEKMKIDEEEDTMLDIHAGLSVSEEDEDIRDAEADADDSEEEADLSDKDLEDSKPEESNTTIFIRNLPFNTDDETLATHFKTFGGVRYARVVYDPETDRPRGTAFVCFFSEDDAKACVKNAPKQQADPASQDKKRHGENMTHSVLQNEASDPSGRYTLDGRVLNVTRALSKADATKREEEGTVKRDQRDKDKRRLYLIAEGTIARGSPLYDKLGPTEINIREASAKQRQKIVKSNPSLHISLTRLSVRNIPRNVTSKELKALARQAVVGFAADVKAGKRARLSKEESSRGGDAMREAERSRKKQGKGIVLQTKIVFEGREGTKVNEEGGAGRSRGYGFIEFFTHRNALMALRWLNGHAVQGGGDDGGKKKRLIVEFAIENAQVVNRRQDREVKARMNPRKVRNDNNKSSYTKEIKSGNSKKRKRDEKNVKEPLTEKPKPATEEEKNKLAKRNRIIAKKRSARKARK